MSRRITSITIKDSVAITYELYNEVSRSWGTHSLEEKEKPLTEFQEALDALAQGVCQLREEPVDWKEHVTVVGITLRHDKNGNSKVVIKAHRALDQGGPAICNTPLTAVTAETDDAYTVSDLVATQIDTLCTQAEAYVDGERSQQTFEFAKKKSKAPSDGDNGDDDKQEDMDL